MDCGDLASECRRRSSGQPHGKEPQSTPGETKPGGGCRPALRQPWSRLPATQGAGGGESWTHQTSPNPPKLQAESTSGPSTPMKTLECHPETETRAGRGSARPSLAGTRALSSKWMLPEVCLFLIHMSLCFAPCFSPLPHGAEASRSGCALQSRGGPCVGQAGTASSDWPSLNSPANPHVSRGCLQF